VFLGFSAGRGTPAESLGANAVVMRASDGRWSTPIASIPNVFIGSRVRWRSTRRRLGAMGAAVVDDPGAVCPRTRVLGDDRSVRRLGAARDAKPCLNEMD